MEQVGVRLSVTLVWKARFESWRLHTPLGRAMKWSGALFTSKKQLQHVPSSQTWELLGWTRTSDSRCDGIFAILYSKCAEKNC
jgi:hypothetical protein